MFESLSESLGNVFRKLSGKGKLTEANIEEGLQEVRRALLAADVSFKIVKDFIDRVKAAAVGAEVLKTINPTQMFISLVHKELADLMGPVDHSIAAAKAGDRSAFDELVRATYTDAYTLAYRLTGNEEDARDVVQDAYLRAYKGLNADSFADPPTVRAVALFELSYRLHPVRFTVVEP